MDKGLHCDHRLCPDSTCVSTQNALKTRNGTDLTGEFDPTLYGWRTNGDHGVITSLTNCYPAFYAAKLMQYLARPGDTIVSASTDFLLLSAYAARRADGAVSLLLVNKSLTTNFNAQILLGGFSPSPTAAVYSYGIPQDNAARTGIGSTDIAVTNFTGAGTNFTFNAAPLSLTVFSLAPTAPSLAAQTPVRGAGQFVFQLRGQPGVPYVIQSSTNLSGWISVVTNTLTGSSLNHTNTLSAGTRVQFWRAVWKL
jgi:hypothetical protein